jgi:hypothetical protein
MAYSIPKLEETSLVYGMYEKYLRPVRDHWNALGVPLELYPGGTIGYEYFEFKDKKKKLQMRLQCAVTAEFPVKLLSDEFIESIFEKFPDVESDDAYTNCMARDTVKDSIKVGIPIHTPFSPDLERRISILRDTLFKNWDDAASSSAFTSFMNHKEHEMSPDWRVNRLILFAETDASSVVPYLRNSKFAKLRLLAGV